MCLPIPKEVAAKYCDNLQATANNVGAIVDECLVCNTDYCNGGPKPIGVSLPALLLVIGLAARQMM
jgi:hypothetical protein